MSRRHRARIQRRLRIIVLSSLITLVGAEAAFLHFAPAKAPPSGITAAVSLPEITHPLPLSHYAAVVAGDVFASTRQPSARVLARVAVPAPEEASTFRVTAIVISGDTRVALVEFSGSAQTQHIHVGDLLAAHRVVAIAPDAITIDNNGLHQDIALSHKSDQSDIGTAPLPQVAGASSGSRTGPVTQAEAEAMYKGFWAMKTSSMPDPMPAMPIRRKPPG
jgi:hypothetical protein